jgi:pimeloyl-ACP methyl ester carboxylesterase
LTPLADAQRLAEALPYAGEPVTIQGAGHLPPWERPEAFSAAFRRFTERWGLEG